MQESYSPVSAAAVAFVTYYILLLLLPLLVLLNSRPSVTMLLVNSLPTVTYSIPFLSIKTANVAINSYLIESGNPKQCGSSMPSFCLLILPIP